MFKYLQGVPKKCSQARRAQSSLMNIFWDTGHMVVDFFLLDVEKPQIALHPQSGVVTSGGSAFFTCTHSNTHLSISWFKNGLRIPGSMTKTTDK